MTAQEFEQMLLAEGVDAATVAALSGNAKLQSRVTALARQNEVDALAAQKAALETSYARAKSYEDWYSRNHAALEALKTRQALYEERYGAIEGTTTQQPTTQPTGKQYTDADIERAIDARMNNQYGPQITDSLVGMGRITEQHFRNGRKNNIDWDDIKKRAIAKGGDLVGAYNEWDAPEAAKAATEQKENEFKERLKSEREKWMLGNSGDGFPAGAGYDSGSGAPSPLSARSDGEVKPYDRNAMLQAVREVRSDPNFTPGFGKRPN